MKILFESVKLTGKKILIDFDQFRTIFKFLNLSVIANTVSYKTLIFNLKTQNCNTNLKSYFPPRG